MSAETRRGLLKKLTVAIGGLVAAVTAWPVFRYIVFPASKRTVEGSGEAVPIGDPAAVVKNGPPVRVEVTVPEQRDAWSKTTQVKLGAAWLVRGDDDELRAFTTTCPHLGCAIDYDDKARVFRCPCHTSAFSLDGKKMSGPAKRGMDELRLEDAKPGQPLRLIFERFVPDISEKKKA